MLIIISIELGRAPVGEIKIGILHSLTGTLAISERILKDTLLMLIRQQNSRGGLLGRRLKPIVVNPASNQALFASLAQRLIVQDKVAVVFGCWTSASRKAVLPIFERFNSILFYPVQWEGEESSRNIFYTGATPNQQAIPAVDYLIRKGIKRWILEGTNYVYPQTTNRILKAYLQQKDVSMNDIREHYTPFSFSNWRNEVTQIKAFGSTGKKTAVISTINGDANVPFYEELARQNISSSQIPVMAFSVGENELTQISAKSRSTLVGHLAAWNYFQSINTQINRQFIRQWHQYTGRNTVTNDPMEATYMGFNMWVKAVRAVQTTNVDAVIKQMIGVAVPNLSGDYASMLANHLITKPVFIGSILQSGQFKIEYKTPGLVAGDAWSDYLVSSKDLISDWRPPLSCGKYNVKTGRCFHR
ncbi:unnamed protein product [Rotaria sp. Silwood1]|nr:unnamed protein product [Rotaria sp. Silwood1]CAF3777683.1 unnamed protein product [Rotaria sp. Silwood1]CAF3856122.1 unnamed protein product [Rotaria sp. Silwood1]CAF4726354.1 unnamed protein product [Rotaria sp. Silwood1]CAF4856055.1 unnamed protein product [Rotaria sp. Silwood1]